MSTPFPSMAVVIPTYQRRPFLCRVIEPLLADSATSEIIVVVDGGDDGSFEFLQTLSARDARMKPVFTENRGQAASQQYGSSLALSDVILFLDDDVIPEQGLVSGHARHHQTANDVVVVGYMPVVGCAMKNSGNWVARRYASRYAARVEAWKRNPETILRTLWGGNLSLRSAHLKKVPIARLEYGLRYHMDLEFGLRCEKAGLRAVFDPLLRSGHDYSRSVEQFLRDRAVSAADRALIHRLHSDTVGPLPENFFREDAPLVVSLMLRLLRGFNSTTAERLMEAVAKRSVAWTKFYRTQEFFCDFFERLRGQRIADDMQQMLDHNKSDMGLSFERTMSNRELRR